MPNRNRLLECLSTATRERLRRSLEFTTLPKGRVLYETGELVRSAYFPLSGMISLLATTEQAEALEVAMVGNDGFIGMPILLPNNTAPYQVLVQIGCDAYRLRSEDLLNEFQRDPHVQLALMSYLDVLICQLAQSSICHRMHSIQQRLCRWLLVSRDCVESDTIALTQEYIAHMLGLSRPKVSLTLAALEDKRFIRQRHGRVLIENAPGLESCSCECYGVVKQRARETLPGRPAPHGGSDGST